MRIGWQGTKKPGLNTGVAASTSPPSSPSTSDSDVFLFSFLTISRPVHMLPDNDSISEVDLVQQPTPVLLGMPQNRWSAEHGDLSRSINTTSVDQEIG